MKKKITRKLAVKKVTLLNYKGGAVAADHDTPTVNDNCDHQSFWLCMPWDLTKNNTYCRCNPGDWCGYEHETNCGGPLITAG